MNRDHFLLCLAAELLGYDLVRKAIEQTAATDDGTETSSLSSRLTWTTRQAAATRTAAAAAAARTSREILGNGPTTPEQGAHHGSVPAAQGSQMALEESNHITSRAVDTFLVDLVFELDAMQGHIHMKISVLIGVSSSGNPTLLPNQMPNDIVKRTNSVFPTVDVSRPSACDYFYVVCHAAASDSDRLGSSKDSELCWSTRSLEEHFSSLAIDVTSTPIPLLAQTMAQALDGQLVPCSVLFEEQQTQYASETCNTNDRHTLGGSNANCSSADATIRAVKQIALRFWYPELGQSASMLLWQRRHEQQQPQPQTTSSLGPSLPSFAAGQSAMRDDGYVSEPLACGNLQIVSEDLLDLVLRHAPPSSSAAAAASRITTDGGMASPKRNLALSSVDDTMQRGVRLQQQQQQQQQQHHDQQLQQLWILWQEQCHRVSSHRRLAAASAADAVAGTTTTPTTINHDPSYGRDRTVQSTNPDSMISPTAFVQQELLHQLKSTPSILPQNQVSSHPNNNEKPIVPSVLIAAARGVHHGTDDNEPNDIIATATYASAGHGTAVTNRGGVGVGVGDNGGVCDQGQRPRRSKRGIQTMVMRKKKSKLKYAGSDETRGS